MTAGPGSLSPPVMRRRSPRRCSAWVPTPISDRPSAARGLQRFEQRFSLYNFGRQTENFYREVLDEWRGSCCQFPNAHALRTDFHSDAAERSVA